MGKVNDGQGVLGIWEKVRGGNWAAVLASWVFSGASFWMLHLYGVVHWRIMMDEQGFPRQGDKEGVYLVLAELGWLQLVFSVLAIVWAVWGFRGGRRWAGLAALVLAVFALAGNLVMT